MAKDDDSYALGIVLQHSPSSYSRLRSCTNKDIYCGNYGYAGITQEHGWWWPLVGEVRFAYCNYHWYPCSVLIQMGNLLLDMYLCRTSAALGISQIDSHVEVQSSIYVDKNSQDKCWRLMISLRGLRGDISIGSNQN